MQKDLESIAFALVAFLKAAIIDLQPQRNDLRQSNLWRSIEWRVERQSVIQILAADYIVFIDSGRRAGAKRVPIGSLLSWIRRNKINQGKISDVSLAYAIQTVIYQKGIKPRPFLENWETKSLEYVAEQIGELFQAEILRNFESLLNKPK